MSDVSTLSRRGVRRAGKIDRLQAVLAGAAPDRTPVALWRHWPEHDQRGDTLARATVEFQRRHDFDFVKLCPATNYAVSGWGGRSEWRGHPMGSHEYLERAVRLPEDWLRLRPLKPGAGLQGEMLEALRLVRAELGDGTPLLPTVFSPLAMAKYLAGEAALWRHLRSEPEMVLAGLRTLAESAVRFLEEAKRAGIDGIFFAVQHASHAVCSENEYRFFGEPFDRTVLAAVADCWLNVLHLHGDAPMFALGAEYPVAAVNWHALECGPGLAEAAAMTGKALCGGLGTEGTLAGGTPEAVRAEMHRAREGAGRNRLIATGGCGLLVATPEANIAAARAAAEA